MKRILIIVLSILFIANPLFAHDGVSHMDGAGHDMSSSVDVSMDTTCQEKCASDDVRVCCAKAAIHCSSAFSCSSVTLGFTPTRSKNVLVTMHKATLLGLVFEAETPPPRI